MVIIITLKTALDDMTRSHLSVSHWHVQAHNLCECLKQPKGQCFPDHTACMQGVTAGLQCADSTIVSAPQSYALQSSAMQRHAQSLHVCADTLLSVLKVMRTQQLWMSAWAALDPWRWCKEKTAQFMLKRWVRRLQAEGVITELAASDIQECFTIPQVCSGTPCKPCPTI